MVSGYRACPLYGAPQEGVNILRTELKVFIVFAVACGISGILANQLDRYLDTFVDSDPETWAKLFPLQLVASSIMICSFLIVFVSAICCMKNIVSEHEDAKEEEKRQQHAQKAAVRAEAYAQCEWCGAPLGRLYFTCEYCTRVFCSQKCSLEHRYRVHTT